MSAHALRFPFVRASIPPPEAWVPYLAASYGEGWFSNGGPAVRELEAVIGRAWRPEREAVAVASATAGLVAVLLALEVEGRVAVPSFTFAATGHAVRMAGCEPVFLDVDPGTWELCAGSVSEALAAGGIAAVVSVRPYGLCRDLAAIEAACRAHGVPLVVDSAAALGGALADGRPAGLQGDAEIFSAHVTKPLGWGEGGVVSASPQLAARVRHAANFALASSAPTGRGLNAKLPETSAAVGLAVMERAPARLRARHRQAEMHYELAAALGGAIEPAADAGKPPWQCFPVRLAGGLDRDSALAALAAEGVEARPYYAPGLHRTAAFRDAATWPPAGLAVTDSLAASVLCLPIYDDADAVQAKTFRAAVARGLSVVSAVA